MKNYERDTESSSARKRAELSPNMKALQRAALIANGSFYDRSNSPPNHNRQHSQGSQASPGSRILLNAPSFQQLLQPLPSARSESAYMFTFKPLLNEVSKELAKKRKNEQIVQFRNLFCGPKTTGDPAYASATDF